MITRLEEIPVTKESYPFASAERYLKLSERGYVEKEYYMSWNGQCLCTADEHGGVRVRTRMRRIQTASSCRAPQGHCKMQRKRCSGDHQSNEFYGD